MIESWTKPSGIRLTHPRETLGPPAFLASSAHTGSRRVSALRFGSGNPNVSRNPLTR